MRHHGVLTSDPKEKVDALGDQFSSVFTEEDLTNIPSLGRPVAPHAPPLYISVNGVAKQLSKLNPNKASGPDGLSPRLLKITATQIAPVLQVIFTQSLDTGDVPADWRAANISPIFKKGDKTSPVNYRPVSLTSYCATVWDPHTIGGSQALERVQRRAARMTVSDYDYTSSVSDMLKRLQTINEWNKLPGQLVKAQTVEAFKAGLLAAQP
ncbi:hypothetical protein Bbelb_280110 [Branchiostoma belcheri]|nr:hypothetical protein Bbelb_280110 [Branchiostoma belcheri]